VAHLLGVTGKRGDDIANPTRQELGRIDRLLERAGSDRSHLSSAQGM